MSNTTIRVSESLLDSIKILKESSGHKSYEDLLKDLVNNEAKKTFVKTKYGYVPIGAVVKDRLNVLVVTSIVGSKVFFDDGTYVINGSRAAYDLVMLATNVEEYDGQRTDC